jgi:LPXTG-motif cell wall-anchored protein
VSRLLLAGAAFIALIVAMAPAPANAITTTYDKTAYLTFSAPVQIPGVTLNAGTYWFRLTNPATSRNVLQVLSNDGSIVYAMFHTIPDRRTTLTEEAVVSFRETPEGVAPAVKSLFYGDEYRGYEFVYPKGGPNMIRELRPQPEITYAESPVAAVPEPVAEAFPRPEPVIEPVAEPPLQPVAEQAPAPAELPRTASPLPFLALGGLTSLLTGLGFGLLRRRAN